ncbi:DUF4338 domain-containing protein [Patescibacteria group bacterium]|nr:DUF4338 domain-containing protein [Patescibacteria group bacterium]
METVMRYRGKVVTDEEVVFIREFIAQNIGDSRWMLSRKLCQAWDWVQPNGALRDMVCRGLMLQLARAGQIELPPIRVKIVNPLVHRKKPSRVAIDQTPLEGKLSDIGPLEFRQVRRTEEEALFNSLIEEHHYLGYCQPVGEQLKYIVFAKERPIACLAWSSAPRHIGDRDQFIGWTKQVREKNLALIACNTRFLILPWVRVSCLASHILGKMVKILPKDWERFYHHPLHYLETFIDQERFHGTCYRAANWIYLGRTTGRGKNDQTGKANRSLKDVLGYPLSNDFRDHLCGGQV